MKDGLGQCGLFERLVNGKEGGRGRAKEWQDKENTEKMEGLTVSWLFFGEVVVEPCNA